MKTVKLNGGVTAQKNGLLFGIDIEARPKLACSAYTRTHELDAWRACTLRPIERLKALRGIVEVLMVQRKRGGVIKDCLQCGEPMWARDGRKKYCKACGADRQRKAVRDYHKTDKGRQKVRKATRKYKAKIRKMKEDSLLEKC